MIAIRIKVGVRTAISIALLVVTILGTTRIAFASDGLPCVVKRGMDPDLCIPGTTAYYERWFKKASLVASGTVVLSDTSDSVLEDLKLGVEKVLFRADFVFKGGDDKEFEILMSNRFFEFASTGRSRQSVLTEVFKDNLSFAKEVQEMGDTYRSYGIATDNFSNAQNGFVAELLTLNRAISTDTFVDVPPNLLIEEGRRYIIFAKPSTSDSSAIPYVPINKTEQMIIEYNDQLNDLLLRAIDSR